MEDLRQIANMKANV